MFLFISFAIVRPHSAAEPKNPGSKTNDSALLNEEVSSSWVKSNTVFEKCKARLNYFGAKRLHLHFLNRAEQF